MSQKIFSILAHRRGFPIQEVGDGAVKIGMGDPVGRVGERREKASVNLVFALRARLEAPQAVPDTIVQTLIIAGFKM